MPRVLVVEDQAHQARATAARLRVEGFDAHAASDASGALTYLELGAFDLAVVDLMMPGTHGIEFARIMRERHPSTLVVLASTYPLSEGQLARADCGAVGFVAKPFDSTALARFLRGGLGSEDGAAKGRPPPDARGAVA